MKEVFTVWAIVNGDPQLGVRVFDTQFGSLAECMQTIERLKPDEGTHLECHSGIPRKSLKNSFGLSITF